jgi:hypothetical protein
MPTDVFSLSARINSLNFTPKPFWHIGAQSMTLNWQTGHVGTALNEVMFSDTNGYGYIVESKVYRSSREWVLPHGSQVSHK